MNTSTNAVTSREVVVGITGPGREQAALRFAAEYAGREGMNVVLVHAIHAGPPPPPPSALLTYADAVDVGGWVVKEVSEEFEHATGGAVAFRGLAVAGSPARVLGDLSHDAALLVVQQRHGQGLGRIFTGSTATGAAARAGCPIVSVNPDWRPEDANGEVVVGVHEDGGPHEVLEAGFAWAARTGVPVRVVHAWRLDGAYDNIISARVDEHWRRDQEQVLERAVTSLREKFPDVEVLLEVRHQWPSDVLVDDSQVASLVVVGRHGSHVWATHHVGSIARTVLREAKSPVMVVPVRAPSGTEGWDLTADEVSPQT
jgi:nucleotide-binding universal stress UspA family protein